MSFHSDQLLLLVQIPQVEIVVQGPNSKDRIQASVGRPFTVSTRGNGLHVDDRIMIVNNDCGEELSQFVVFLPVAPTVDKQGLEQNWDNAVLLRTRMNNIG